MEGKHRIRTCRSTVILAFIVLLGLLSLLGNQAYAETSSATPAPLTTTMEADETISGPPTPMHKEDDVDLLGGNLWKSRVVWTLVLVMVMVVLITIGCSQDGSKDGRIERLRELRDAMDDADGDSECEMI